MSPPTRLPGLRASALLAVTPVAAILLASMGGSADDQAAQAAQAAAAADGNLATATTAAAGATPAATAATATAATTAAPATTAGPTTTVPCTNWYTVLAGDSWYGIAAASSSDVSALFGLNGADATSVLQPGDAVCLPAGATITTTTAPVTTAAPAATAIAAAGSEKVR